jgi:Chorion family 3.
MNARFAVVMMVLVALAIMAFPATAAINKIPAGGEVFLGEKGLDVSAATGGASQIAWWQPGTNTETEQPADIQQVTNAQSFYVLLISSSERPATGISGTAA